MDYARPRFSVQEVNAAAKKVTFFVKPDDLPSAEELGKALEIIDNWRASHNFPLNSFHITLKNRARKIHAAALTAQRIKRLESIAFKLMNEPRMKLSQMQDIGGCRAVMPSIAKMNELRECYAQQPLTHFYSGEKDYIADPKSTGYRGVHLKYRFVGRSQSVPWDGLKIEIQLRTLLQHKWATAVEAAGTFTRSALKSNRGRPEWLRFFALMSSMFALREECPTIPGTPQTLDELCAEIRELNRQYHIEATFSQYRTIIPHMEKMSGAKYFLVQLDPIKLEVKIQGYKSDESQQANKAYTYLESRLEKDTPTQVVLVSVSSVSALKRAYPNYFLDTDDFLRELSAITRSVSVVA
jgi:RelA/SpoT family protein